MARPTRVRVRMYNVGFGDCFLVSFRYAAPVGDAAGGPERIARHVLFDFGSSRAPRNRQSMVSVAMQVAADCDGQLDAVVISHRHRDHLSAFGADATAKVLAALQPRLIVRSWTEDPALERDAGAPGATEAFGGSPDRDLIASLAAGAEVARGVFERSMAAGRGRRSTLVELAEDELANADAVKELDRLAALAAGEYLASTPPDGAAQPLPSRLGDYLPGVTVEVLGPPRPSAWPAVARQASESKEYWVGVSGRVDRLFSDGTNARPAVLGTSRWIIDRLQQDEERQLTTLVRWLDEALNNTSVILLLKAGEHQLLFGGDAQIENWSWALRADADQTLRAALAAVDFYKVGHHGSRNATPKSLVSMWQGREGRLLSLMSTKSGVHGHGDRTVPRATLVDALAALGDLHSTDGDVRWIDAETTVPRGEWTVTITK